MSSRKVYNGRRHVAALTRQHSLSQENQRPSIIFNGPNSPYTKTSCCCESIKCNSLDISSTLYRLKLRKSLFLPAYLHYGGLSRLESTTEKRPDIRLKLSHRRQRYREITCWSWTLACDSWIFATTKYKYILKCLEWLQNVDIINVITCQYLDTNVSVSNGYVTFHIKSNFISIIGLSWFFTKPKKAQQ